LSGAESGCIATTPTTKNYEVKVVVGQLSSKISAETGKA
jgi:hypothetical protein